MPRGLSRKEYALTQRAIAQKAQNANEHYYSERFVIADAIKELKDSEEVNLAVQYGVQLLEEWASQKYWDTKNERIQSIQELDKEELVFKITSLIALRCIKPMTLVSVCSMTAHYLNMAVKGEAMQTIAEIIAVLADADTFDLYKESKDSSVLVKTKIQLSNEIMERSAYTHFLPPSVAKPRKLHHNRHTGYYNSYGDSLILGGYENHHNNTIGLDVLNTMNSNQYELDIGFLKAVDEVPSTSTKERFEMSDEDWYALPREEREMIKLEYHNWETYKEQCVSTYLMLVNQGNKFYFTHKVDKRGRIYSVGYHVNPQGSSYKKAMLNLKRKEKVQVPAWAK